MSAMSSSIPIDTKRLLASAILAFIAAYIFGSLAIDRGNWLYYGLAAASIMLGIRSLWRGLKLLKKQDE